MPSTHSSSIAFFGVYLSLCIWNLRPHPRFLPHLLSRHGDSGDFSPVVRLFLTSAVAFGAISVCWSRVRLTYHTKAQVIAGAGVGSAIAVGCFVLWQTTLRQHSKWAEGIVEALLLDVWQSIRNGSMHPLKENVGSLHSRWQEHVRVKEL
jgi:membrane-associated phospholipid phosphatase